MDPITPTARSNIAILAKAFGHARGIKPATVSRLIRGDMNFLRNFTSGKVGMTLTKYDEVMQWFEDHWPEGHDMPNIKRPFEVSKK